MKKHIVGYLIKIVYTIGRVVGKNDAKHQPKGKK